MAKTEIKTGGIKDLNVTVAKLPAAVDISTKTVTLPASVSGLGTGITAAQLTSTLDLIFSHGYTSLICYSVIQLLLQQHRVP